MSRSVSGKLSVKVCLFVLMTGISARGSAAPTGSGEPLTAPLQADARPSVTDAIPGTGKAWGGMEAATTGSPGSRAGQGLHDPLPELSGKAPETPGRIKPMPASAIPLEEDLRVDRLDALRAVLHSTADAMPWLHLPPSPQQARLRAARGGSELATAMEHAVRYDDGRAPSGAAEQNRSGVGKGDAVPELIREILRFVHEFLANPLAWMMAFLAVMVAVTLSVFRKRAK